MNVNLCDIDEGVKKRLKEFQLRKQTNIAAIMLKIDTKERMVKVEEEFEDCSIDELQSELPEHQPRYLVLSYVLHHDDGRISYPLCFIFSTPESSHNTLQMMYTSTQPHIYKATDMTKSFVVRDLEEFTEEWLIKKLKGAK